MWECNHVISFVVELNSCLRCWTTDACLVLSQEHNWTISRSNHISFIQYTKERFFQNINQQKNKMHWMSKFPYSNRQESWAAVLTSFIAISITLRWRLVCTRRETVGLCHYHHYHYHHCSNPVYCLNMWQVQAIRHQYQTSGVLHCHITMLDSALGPDLSTQ